MASALVPSDSGDEQDLLGEDQSNRPSRRTIAIAKLPSAPSLLLLVGSLVLGLLVVGLASARGAPGRLARVEQVGQEELEAFDMLWPASGPAKAICIESAREVGSRLECQQEAVFAGSQAYQYSAVPSRCAQCASSTVVRGYTQWPWQIYAKGGVALVAPTSSALLPGTHISLFCLAVMRPQGFELDLMNLQAQKGAGVFGCDEAQVFSGGGPLELGPGPNGMIHTTGIPALNDKIGRKGVDGMMTNSFLNSGTFIHVWDLVLEEGRYAKHHWVVKQDPDAVFFAGRLRDRLRVVQDPVAFVVNCRKDNWFALYGAVEAFTTGAMAAYKAGKKQCIDTLQWSLWGEDYYLAKCFVEVHTKLVKDFGQLSDAYCVPTSCSDGTKAAYHPFKQKGEWLQCYEQASQLVR